MNWTSHVTHFQMDLWVSLRTRLRNSPRTAHKELLAFWETNLCCPLMKNSLYSPIVLKRFLHDFFQLKIR